MYALIEILWRGYTHWSMAVVGGLCFIVLGMHKHFFSENMPLLAQAIIGTFFVTFIELISGLILNVWLGLSVWDYSHVPFNFLGQICLPYMFLWLPLSMLAIILYDWLRYWLFNEQKPTYKLI